MKKLTDDAREQLAAAYVIGLLKGPARKRFERWMLESFELRQEVWFWERQLFELPVVQPLETPGKKVWENIETRLGWKAAKKTQSSWWLGFLGASALSIILAVTLVVQTFQPTSPSLERIAVIQDQEATPLWTIAFNYDTGDLTLKAERIQKTNGKDYELWLLSEGTAPVSAGILPLDESELRLKLTPDQLKSLQAGYHLAVSLEPEGGSQTGQPTGPVLYQSKLVQL